MSLVICPECGKEVSSLSSSCPNCGYPINDERVSSMASVPNQGSVDDSSSFGLAVLGFLIPFLGLILYLVWMKDKPKKAGSVGKGALIGGIINFLIIMMIW